MTKIFHTWETPLALHDTDTHTVDTKRVHRMTKAAFDGLVPLPVEHIVHKLHKNVIQPKSQTTPAGTVCQFRSYTVTSLA